MKIERVQTQYRSSICIVDIFMCKKIVAFSYAHFSRVQSAECRGKAILSSCEFCSILLFPFLVCLVFFSDANKQTSPSLTLFFIGPRALQQYLTIPFYFPPKTICIFHFFQINPLKPFLYY